MKRTTILLPANLKTRALRRARQLGISIGELIRQSLTVLLNHDPDEASEGPLFADRAVYTARAPKDTAARHDDYLIASHLS